MAFVQDWEQVVFKKEQPKIARCSSAPPKPIDLETKRLKVYSKELSDAMMSSRLEKKMSQVELAKRCNVVPGVINEVEARKGVYNADLVNRILKVLNIKVDNRFSFA
jgi:ribosome-binding protein aMBF1 (putative translation factor)